MQISFPILERDKHKPKSPAVENKQLIQEQNQEIEIAIAEYEKQLKSRRRTYVRMFVIFALLLIGSFFIDNLYIILGIYTAFSMLVLVFHNAIGFKDIFNRSNTDNYSSISLLYKKNGKIAFLDTGIRITKDKENVVYPYQKMETFSLYFKGVSIKDEYKHNKLKWKIGDENYEEIFLLENSYSQDRLLDVLKYLYKKEIPIKEWNENWEALHLLSLPERPKSLNEEDYKPIDEKYLRMIEDIGKKEAEEEV